MPRVNFTRIENVTDLLGLTDFISVESDGFFLVGFAILITVVFFVAMSRWDWESAFVSTTVFVSIMAIFFKAMGLISELAMFAFLVVSVISILTLTFRKKLGL